MLRIMIKFVLIPVTILSLVVGILVKTYNRWGPKFAETRQQIKSKRAEKRSARQKKATQAA